MSLLIRQQVSDSEKHLCNVSVLLNLGDQVVSGDDTGKLKVWFSRGLERCRFLSHAPWKNGVWTGDLKLKAEVDSKCGAILSLAAGPDVIYSCTSNQALQAWDRKTLQNIGKLEQTSLSVPQKVFYEPTTDVLWVGDSQGHVAKYVDKEMVAIFDLTEEIWDLHVEINPILIFTARDRDVLVSEIVTGQLRSNAVVKSTMEGRYPIAKIQNTLCCLARDGRKIMVHEYSLASRFKLLREIPAGKMILNALCPGNGATVYTGGYEGEVSLWDVNSGQFLGKVNFGSCVNALASTNNGAYVALEDGRILLVGL